MIREPSDVHETVRMGDGSVIWRFAQVMAGVVLGEQCSVGSGAYIGRDTKIGDRVRISQGAHVTDHMTIGDDVFIGPHVVMTNDKHPVVNNRDFRLDPPVIESDVSIGAGAVLLPGVRLGRGCRIGAGAVVSRDVAPHTTVVGNPARPLVKEARYVPEPSCEHGPPRQSLGEAFLHYPGIKEPV